VQRALDGPRGRGAQAAVSHHTATTTHRRPPRARRRPRARSTGVVLRGVVGGLGAAAARGDAAAGGLLRGLAEQLWRAPLRVTLGTQLAVRHTRPADLREGPKTASVGPLTVAVRPSRTPARRWCARCAPCSGGWPG
jgi:hypothetical protein